MKIYVPRLCNNKKVTHYYNNTYGMELIDTGFWFMYKETILFSCINKYSNISFTDQKGIYVDELYKIKL